MSEREPFEAPSRDGGGRDSRGQRTRQALQDAAFRLMEGDKSFSALSLREVAREAGVVPTAFYRHFRDMKELGLALVDETMRTLRQAIRAARSAGPVVSEEQAIRSAVETLARHVQAHRLHFRFIARELASGRTAMRQAIRHEVDLFLRELALDLSRMPALIQWSTEDLQMMASLIVNILIDTAEQLLDVPARRPEAEEAVIRMAEKQLRLIMLAATLWPQESAAGLAARDGKGQ
ncbi:MAG: TetR family transcriptional regulator [Nevskia sp.]|nr:TetR family transcriptional regulator [Nevskia sp.]